MTRTRKPGLFIILTALTALVAAVLSVFMLPALAQENKKIPFEIDDGRAAAEPLARQPAQHRLGLGINLDFFPTIVSAVDGEFGLSIQPWFGIDQFKIRLNITHLRIPDSLVGSRFFYKNTANTFSLAVEYCFGNNFDGFTAGAGIGVWNNMVSHKYFNKKGISITPFLTLEGGYIWKFYNNLFIEPCLALDVMLTGQKIKIYGFGFKPLPVSGEITLKFGLNVDI
jgi:hypothetical protein